MFLRPVLVALSFASLVAPAVAADAPAAAGTAPLSAAAARAQLESVPANDPAYDELHRLHSDGFLAKHNLDALVAQRLLTRYEVAALTSEAAQEMRDRLALLAQPSPPPTPTMPSLTSVSQADIDAIKALLDRYGSDIDALKADVAALWDATGRTHDQVQDLQKQVNRQKIGVTYYLRAPGLFSDHVTAYNGGSTSVTSGGFAVAPFALLPAGTPVTVGNNPGQIGQNALTAGDSGHGTGYQVLRLTLSGIVNDMVQYRVRLEDRYYFDNAVGQSTTVPNYCITAGCTGDYPANSTLRLNFANVLLTPTKNLSLTAGRFSQGEGPFGLGYEDYFNGGAVAYHNGPLDAAAGYGFGIASLSNSGGAVATTGSSYFAQGSYAINPRISAGVSFLANMNYAGQQYFNPSAPLKDANGNTIVDVNGVPITGAYVATNANEQVATVFGSYHNTHLFADVEGLHRFGTDPLTGSHWTDADAYWLQVRYGYPQFHANGNYAEAGLIQAGLNSTAPQTKLVGSTSYQLFYLNNPNGYRIGYLGVHHWLGENAQIGLEYQHYGLVPNTILPASSVLCPGCVVTKDNKDALLLETLLSF
ncbi:MAG: hypothetical protein JO103_12195 [Candidatus Eremiobacteraeota bacterium]|nr:hypothetical protein [Candidatus Eremiobacteraeota bacterium]